MGGWRLSAEGEREKVSEVWARDGGVDRMRGLNVSAEGRARELCEVWADSVIVAGGRTRGMRREGWGRWQKGVDELDRWDELAVLARREGWGRREEEQESDVRGSDAVKACSGGVRRLHLPQPSPLEGRTKASAALYNEGNCGCGMISSSSTT